MAELSERARASLRSYFRDNWECDNRERGCLLLVSDEIAPFVNVADDPYCTIEQGRDDFRTMAGFFYDDKIAAIAHSHPVFAARPSLLDLDGHRYGFDMVIYSCVDDVFARFTGEEIKELRRRHECSFGRMRGDRILGGAGAGASDRRQAAG